MHSTAHTISHYCCNYSLQLLFLSLYPLCRKCMNYKQMEKHIKHCFRRYAGMVYPVLHFLEKQQLHILSWIWQWGQISIELVLSSSAANFNSEQNLFLFETFQCYLISFFHKKILKCFPELISLCLLFFIFHQMIALQKLWKMLFISSKKLFSFLKYSNFCISILPSFSSSQPLL